MAATASVGLAVTLIARISYELIQEYEHSRVIKISDSGFLFRPQLANSVITNLNRVQMKNDGLLRTFYDGLWAVFHVKIRPQLQRTVLIYFGTFFSFIRHPYQWMLFSHSSRVGVKMLPLERLRWIQATSLPSTKTTASIGTRVVLRAAWWPFFPSAKRLFTATFFLALVLK